VSNQWFKKPVHFSLDKSSLYFPLFKYDLALWKPTNNPGRWLPTPRTNRVKSAELTLCNSSTDRDKGRVLHLHLQTKNPSTQPSQQLALASKHLRRAGGQSTAWLTSIITTATI